MVLPSPVAAGAPPSPSWVRTLVSRDGPSLDVAYNADDHQMAALLRAMQTRFGAVRVCETADEVFTSPPESALVLRPREDQLEALNVGRPKFERLRLRTVLWCTRAMWRVIQAKAPDLYDWRSRTVEVPNEPPAWAVQSLLACEQAVSNCEWRGPLLHECVALAWPGRALVRLDARTDYPVLLTEIDRARDAFIAFDHVLGERELWRARWALAEKKRRTGCALVDVADGVSSPGWQRLHATPMPWELAVDRLRAADDPTPALTAALCALQPEKINALLGSAPSNETILDLSEPEEVEAELFAAPYYVGLYHQGAFGLALNHLRRLVRDGDHESPLHRLLMQGQLGLGRYATVIDNADPESSERYSALARSFDPRGPVALEHARSVGVAHDGVLELAIALGAALSPRDFSGRWVWLLLEAVGTYVVNNESVRSLLRNDAHQHLRTLADSFVALSMSRVLLRFGHVASAVMSSVAAREFFASHLGPAHHFTGRALLAEGRALFADGQWAAARDTFARAIDALAASVGSDHPDTHEARFEHAWTRRFLREEDTTPALRAHFAAIITRVPETHPRLRSLQERIELRVPFVPLDRSEPD